MSNMQDKQEERQHFADLIEDFNTALLVSHNGESLQARPMRLAQCDENGSIWFLTGKDTAKVGQIEQDGHVLVSMQDGDKKSVSITGFARLVRDRAKLDEIWKKEYEVWFTEGKDDSNIVLIHVQGEAAQYWDNSGINVVTYAFRAAKSLLTKDRPDEEKTDPKSYGEVNLNSQV